MSIRENLPVQLFGNGKTWRAKKVKVGTIFSPVSSSTKYAHHLTYLLVLCWYKNKYLWYELHVTSANFQDPDQNVRGAAAFAIGQMSEFMPGDVVGLH
jgi:hypothetical protein